MKKLTCIYQKQLGKKYDLGYALESGEVIFLSENTDKVQILDPCDKKYFTPLVWMVKKSALQKKTRVTFKFSKENI